MSTGAIYAALAFAAWGIFPLYFRQIAHVPSGEILIHRIVWSLVFVVIALSLRLIFPSKRC